MFPLRNLLYTGNSPLAVRPMVYGYEVLAVASDASDSRVMGDGAAVAAAAAAEEDDDADISGAASISNRWAEEENNAKAGWTDVRGTRGAVEMARGGTAIRAARMAPERGRRSADIVADRGGRNVDWRL